MSGEEEDRSEKEKKERNQEKAKKDEILAEVLPVTDEGERESRKHSKCQRKPSQVPQPTWEVGWENEPLQSGEFYFRGL